MSTIFVTDKDFEEKVLQSKIPALVDFWASWCGPCRLAEPVLEDLSDQYKESVTVVKLNVDENPNSTSKYNIMSIPTTVLFKNGKELGRQVGFSGKQAFEDLIKKGLS